MWHSRCCRAKGAPLLPRPKHLHSSTAAAGTQGASMLCSFQQSAGCKLRLCSFQHAASRAPGYTSVFTSSVRSISYRSDRALMRLTAQRGGGVDRAAQCTAACCRQHEQAGGRQERIENTAESLACSGSSSGAAAHLCQTSCRLGPSPAPRKCPLVVVPSTCCCRCCCCCHHRSCYYRLPCIAAMNAVSMAAGQQCGKERRQQAAVAAGDGSLPLACYRSPKRSVTESVCKQGLCRASRERHSERAVKRLPAVPDDLLRVFKQ